LRSAVLSGGALTLGGAGGVAGLVDYFTRELVNTILHLGINKVQRWDASTSGLIADEPQQVAHLRTQALLVPVSTAPWTILNTPEHL